MVYYAPVVTTTTSIIISSNKIQNGSILVTYRSTWKMAVKWREKERENTLYLWAFLNQSGWDHTLSLIDCHGEIFLQTRRRCGRPIRGVKSTVGNTVINNILMSVPARYGDTSCRRYVFSSYCHALPCNRLSAAGFWFLLVFSQTVLRHSVVSTAVIAFAVSLFRFLFRFYFNSCKSSSLGYVRHYVTVLIVCKYFPRTLEKISPVILSNCELLF